MPGNDPSSESTPVLIVSDGEEGHLVEKVIIEPTPELTEPADEANPPVAPDGEHQVSTAKKEA